MGPRSSQRPAYPTERQTRVIGAAPGSVELPTAMRAAILDHCRRGLPNEACGLIAGDAAWTDGGRAARWLPARNALASPHRYELHAEDLIRLTLDIDAADQVIWAIVHSHVGSAAVPSKTDLREARYPEALQIVVALAPAVGGSDGAANLRAWRVRDGGLEELELIG